MDGRFELIAGTPEKGARSRKVSSFLRVTAIVFLISTTLDGLNLSGLVGRGNTLSSILGLVLVVAFVLAGGPRVRIGGTGWRWFLVFVFATLIAEFYRFSTLPSVFAARSLRTYFTTIQVFAMFFIFRDIASDSATRRALIKWFVSVTCLLSVVAIATWLVGQASRGGRVSVLHRNENEFAFTLGLAAMFFVWWLLGSGRRSLQKRKWLVVPISLLLFAVVLTGSRGGALAAAVGVIVVAVVLYRINRTSIYVVVVPLVFGGMLLSLYLSPVLGQRFIAAAQGTDLGSRPELVEAGLHLAADYPVFGVGPAYDWFLGGELGYERIAAHNTYLQVLLSYGAVGFVPFMVFLLVVAHHAWRIRRSPGGALALGAIASLLVFFVTGHELNYKITWVVLALVVTVQSERYPVQKMIPGFRRRGGEFGALRSRPLGIRRERMSVKNPEDNRPNVG